MKLMDRVLELDPQKTVPGNLSYEIHRIGLKGTGVGVVAFAGGLIAEAAGVEAGAGIALAGAVTGWLGTVATVWTRPNLS